MSSKKNEKNKHFLNRFVRFFCVCNKNSNKINKNAASPLKISSFLPENAENFENQANFRISSPKSVTDNSERRESFAKIQQKTKKIRVKTRHLVSTIEVFALFY